ncbi:DUF4267 domain-containing protein [Streptomyces sp. NPDC052225]|uniref:DUF4267 domain-containing protein n=1 Tax=Streptomyces sp. NPDC052225 TaxID=3154949 RepID=UPI00342E2F89
MLLKKINTVLAAAFVLFALWFGSEFILTPETTAPTFGLPSWPSGDGGGFLVVKGVRDVTMALGMGILLVTGHRRALGLVMLVEAFAAFGDMANVLAHHGSAATAFGVHGLTGAVMVLNALLLIHETRKAAAAVPAAVTAAEGAAAAPVRQSV